MKIKSIYIIGALKNWKVVEFGNYLRRRGFDVFDNWLSPGPLADVYLRKYTRLKGLNYKFTIFRISRYYHRSKISFYRYWKTYRNHNINISLIL